MKTSLIFLSILFLFSCATIDEQFEKPEGEVLVKESEESVEEFPENNRVPAPWGYYEFCVREPESVFCQ